MTAQIPDSIEISNKQHSIVASTDGQIFNLLAYLSPLKPKMLSTACYRGYIASFALDSSKSLIVRDIKVNSPDVNALLNDAPPYCEWDYSRGENGRSYAVSYEGLNLRLPINGKVRACRDFINSMYVHGGFQHFISFNTVIDLSFEDGFLIGQKDLSEETSRLRTIINNEARRQGKDSYLFVWAFSKKTDHPDFVSFRNLHGDF